MRAAPFEGSGKPDVADIVLTNARIYTVNDAQPWADAVAIRGEEIVYLGSDDSDDFRALVGPTTNAFDIGGAS